MKRNRLRLALFVQLEPGVWACGKYRHDDEVLQLHEMCSNACTQIEQDIVRARSQWSMSSADVERTMLARAVHCTLWLGNVQLER